MVDSHGTRCDTFMNELWFIDLQISNRKEM